MTSYYRDDMTRLPEMGVVARQLWETSGLGPDDMQCAVLYDHFTPFVLYQLEELGFCEWGEAKEFVRDGHIGPGGKLPTNTHGGQLGEAYIHGMNGIAEGVRQVRGTAVNQVEGTSSTSWSPPAPASPRAGWSSEASVELTLGGPASTPSVCPRDPTVPANLLVGSERPQ